MSYITKHFKGIANKRTNALRSLSFQFKRQSLLKHGFDGREYRLKDNSLVYITEFKPGGVAVDANSSAPLPIGENVLLDGTTLYIGMGGVIGMIVTKDGKRTPAVSGSSK